MMLKELLAYPGFHFADSPLVTIGSSTFKSRVKALRAFYGHYTVVAFHVVAGSTEIDSVELVK